MANRPNRPLRIADDLGSLPLPPVELWVPPMRRRPWLPSVVLLAGGFVLTLAVVIPLAAGVGENGERSGAAASVSPSPAATASALPSTTANAAVPSSIMPVCALGESPMLHITFPPPPGSQPGTGSASAEAAFRRSFPTVTTFTMYEFGSDQPTKAPAGGVVWIVAGSDTYIAQILGDTNGRDNWFAYRATFTGCRSLSAPGTQIVACGTVTAFAADGAHMLLAITSRGTTLQFNLQYQFAKEPVPTDIGDRLAANAPQLLRVQGRLTDPDTGWLGPRTLQDFSITRVSACP